MISLVRNRDYSGLAIFLLGIILIGWQEMVAPAIGITGLILITDIILSKKYTFFFSKLHLLFVVLFLLYLIGLIWSEHQEIGWKLLEYKMSFFIFPLFFLFRKIDTNYLNILSGLLVGAYILVARLLFHSFTESSDLSFYEISRQGIFIHPTYVCIYLSFGIFITWYFYFKNKTYLNLLHAFFASSLFGFITIGSQSLAGILFLILIIAAIPGYFLYLKFKIWGVLTYLILMPSIGYFTITNLSFLKYDLEIFAAIKDEIALGKEGFLNMNKNSISGNKERVIMWFISAEIISENPFGVGLGDIDFAIAEKAEKYALSNIQKTPLNPHNQFLQIGIDIGYLGIFFLLSMLGYLIYVGIKNANSLVVFTVCSLLFNSLFESVLQRQSGIVFYTLVICLAICVVESTSLKKQIIKPNS